MNDEEMKEAKRLEMFHKMSVTQRQIVEQREASGWILIAVKDYDGTALLYNPNEPGRLSRVAR